MRNDEVPFYYPHVSDIPRFDSVVRVVPPITLSSCIRCANLTLSLRDQCASSYAVSVHECVFHVHKAGSYDEGANVGLVSVSMTTQATDRNIGHCYYGSNGSIFGYDDPEHPTGVTYCVYDTMTATLDLDANTVRFSKNGAHVPTSTVSIDYTAHLFAFDTLWPGNVVTILSMTRAKRESNLLNLLVRIQGESVLVDNMTPPAMQQVFMEHLFGVFFFHMPCIANAATRGQRVPEGSNRSTEAEVRTCSSFRRNSVP